MTARLRLVTEPARLAPSVDPALRGFHVVYRAGETNHCPGCGRSHWLVGRALAECAFCACALPLADAEGLPWRVER